MKTGLRTKIVLVCLLVAPLLTAFAVPSVAQVTFPDTSCQPGVGVGASDTPHAYHTTYNVDAGDPFSYEDGDAHLEIYRQHWTYGWQKQTILRVDVKDWHDECPDHYSGEFGYGASIVWLFSREGVSANGGSGVVTCYGSTDPTAGRTTGHHGTHTTVNVLDDNLGGAIAFTVTRDYNRTPDNPWLPSSNDQGNFDCGDGIIEPCDPLDPYGSYWTAPGCNPLDDAQYVFPQAGICTGLSNLGDIPLEPDPNFVGVLVNFGLSLVGLANDDAACTVPPGPNSWTTPGTLADYAGADGAIVVFIESNFRFDAGHFGTGTTGAVWTE